MKKIGILLIQLLGVVVAGKAQLKYHVKDDILLTVSGTSTLHNWNMRSTKGECNAIFVLNNAGMLTGVSSLNFSTPVYALKSEHAAMDRNAYSALKADKNPVITYHLASANIMPDGSIQCLGQLIMAGVTQNEVLIATAKVNSDRSIVVSCTKKISMTDFNVTPPSLMLGAIKTGNEITLQFSLPLKME